MSRIYSSVPDGKGSIIACSIKIDGKEVLHQSGSYHLELNQKMCDHSSFRLLCPADAFESSRDFPLTNSKNLFGKKIYISFKQFSDTTFIFQGIINQLNWKIENNNPQLELIGKSPTILLEQGEICRSYENQTLEQIVTQTCEGLPQDLFELKVKPKYKKNIPYNVQYQETNFEYLQRLACRYGELLYWNGERLVFGGYGGRKVLIQEGEDAEYIQLQMEAKPQGFSLSSYQAEQNILFQSDTNSLQKKRIINHYQEFALETSEKLFAKKQELFYNYPLLNHIHYDLYDTLERKRQAQQNVLYAKAKTNNPNLRVGDLVKLSAWTP
ncbi:hypothetical protein ETU08_00500, partial [Apibacter muscae]|uniref:contractile injection system protein, VgrG/Pvc8 family n=1 Tax=Apibacter muscae TaxID=2509004 RepID=UPI0011ACE071